MPMPVDIRPTEIKDVLEVQTGLVRDERGYFSEAYSRRTWGEAGFTEEFVQDNISLSSKGTLRGLHYQIEPHGMGKLVRVLLGSVFDVGVDLREGSPTFGKWIGRTLSAENGLALYLPSGFAHGFVALEDDTKVYYKCTNIHTPDAERSLLYKDPNVGIEWPIEPTVISPKDEGAPTMEHAEYNFAYHE